MDASVVWGVIDTYFRENPGVLVRHHTDSYNEFFRHGIYQIFRDKNPMEINSATTFDKSVNEYRASCKLYFGGRDGTKVYFGKPVVYDDEKAHYMFPNEARLRNMTYEVSIHYDVDIEFTDLLDKDEAPSVVGGAFARAVEGGEILYSGVGSDSESESDTESESDEGEAEGGAPRKKTCDFKAAGARALDAPRKRVAGFGGAKAPKKKPAKTLQEKYNVTPQMAAILKEEAEKSVEPDGPGGVRGYITQRRTHTIEKIFLCKIPIMVKSDLCILSGMPADATSAVGECRNDIGGYFIIGGKEKTVVPQEGFAPNMLNVQPSSDDAYLFAAEIRSVSENISKPTRKMSVKIVAPSAKFSNRQIVVAIPNVRRPVPLFVLFRALGVISDRDITAFCVLDLERYADMLPLFVPSIHDASPILTQDAAIKYIATFTKGKTESAAMEILSDYFLPHVGEINFVQKAYFLGHMVFRLLSVQLGLEPPTDRDNMKFKRIELVGSLISDLVREYFTKQQKEVYVDFEKRLYYHIGMYGTNLFGLITNNYKDVFKAHRVLDEGVRKAFNGNWGAYSHTKRIGVIQALDRLSFNSALAHLRKTNLAMPEGVSLIEPRLLHTSQWGFVDPCDTPDGKHCGLHKNLTLMAHVSMGMPRDEIVAWLRTHIHISLVEECTPRQMAGATKLFVNGLWLGIVTPEKDETPLDVAERVRQFRRNALIPVFTSVTFDVRQDALIICTDAGRLCRPLIYRARTTGAMSTSSKFAQKILKDGDYTWQQLVSGFNARRTAGAAARFTPRRERVWALRDLYEVAPSEGADEGAEIHERFLEKCAILDYVDCSESEGALIALDVADLEAPAALKYTHSELHESLMFGMMGSQSPFPENNCAPRVVFSCAHSKQACSMYHTNYQVRMETAIVLNHGQTPLVKSRYLQYLNGEENSYGENVIVAIMCYTGYNVEDAVLINEGSAQRGMFRTSYYKTYEATETTERGGDGGTTETRLANVEAHGRITGTKMGFDYSRLDAAGVVREGTKVTDDTILIGMATNSSDDREKFTDASEGAKKGQVGVVDRTCVLAGEDGLRVAKVRVLEQRSPNIGDKFASRCGQKGTVGLVVPERDMPFTKDGVRPDIIVNPHAIPSRMTISQLVETITGKACAIYGGFGDCTAFSNRGSKLGVFGEMLVHAGLHSGGTELLYNGMTGEQMESEIFIGPTYYLRLKHMVKDKINYRSSGPRTQLTRQPVSGRAKDGGLRVGEMERDALLSYGMSGFMREAMMERGDAYRLAVCNHTGMTAVYTPWRNLFLSPMADGPLQFSSSVEGDRMTVKHVSRFGRDFSVVEMPYSMKLLMQEMQTMGVCMRVITEDNVDQIESMAFSRNLGVLMHAPNATGEAVVSLVKKALNAAGTEFSLHGEADDSVRDSQRTATLVSNTKKKSSAPREALKFDELEPELEMEAPEPKRTGGGDRFAERFGFRTGGGSKSLFASDSDIDLEDDADDDDEEKAKADDEPTTGDEVFLRGDVKPSRIWRIVADGVKFNTIETDDVEGLESAMDATRVVAKSDVYRPVPLAEGAATLSPALAPAAPAGIVFAPQIKVFSNGSDQSHNVDLGPAAASANPGFAEAAAAVAAPAASGAWGPLPGSEFGLQTPEISVAPQGEYNALNDPKMKTTEIRKIG